uniref:endogenous retrovirus group K member 24 Gag polyprotein-like n=1 Tax=Callithrix jacchus TaxID=9483 RepID=UPI0023DD554D|nr:endogenous retrovirus group K member 24 Gag polyprotein-like [Callithrix jacchus]
MEKCESRNQSMFTSLHQMLRNRGTDVKMKHVSKFLEIVYELCLWVPEEGSLDESTWSKIGTKIEEYATTHQSSPQAELLLSVWPQFCHAVCLPAASLASNPSSSYKSNPDDGGGGCNLPPCNPLNQPNSALGVGMEAGSGGARDKGIGTSTSENMQVCPLTYLGA